MSNDYVPPVAPLPPMAERNVTSVLEAACARSPDKIALRGPEGALSYADLRAQALALAGGFDGLGLARQEAVLLMLDNHLDHVRAWLALSLTARIEVPVNTAYIGTILAHVIENSGARVMVLEARFLPALAAVAGELPTLRDLVVRGDYDPGDIPPGLTARPFATLPAAPAQPVTPDPWDLIAIMYTSGTTGLSKGVRITHAHAYGYAAPQLYGACGPEDTALVALPLFHVGGQWKGVYNALIAGATAAVVPRFSAAEFWDEVRRYRCTYTLILGAMVEFLLRQPERPDDRDHSLRRVLLVPVTAELDRFRGRFGIETVSSSYGSTEASVVLFSRPGEAVPGKIGWCRPDFEARLVDPHGFEVPRGTAGELVLRAREPWVMMAGYHRMPQATQDAWMNLWFHTGDLMRQDADGMFAFVDRSKDAIRRRGENVSSFEVEREIQAHPDVAECAVVGVRSAVSEDDILACVVRRPGAGLTAPALLAFLRPRMPYFMVPRYVRFMDALPKTPTEKIRKQALRDEGVTQDTHDAGDRRA